MHKFMLTKNEKDWLERLYLFSQLKEGMNSFAAFYSTDISILSSLENKRLVKKTKICKFNISSFCSYWKITKKGKDFLGIKK